MKTISVKKYSNTNYSQKANDWVLFLSMECETLSQARKIELHIKNEIKEVYKRLLSLSRNENKITFEIQVQLTFPTNIRKVSAYPDIAGNF